MKHNPLDTRENLAKFPKFTQRFWSWLLSITYRNEPPRVPWTVNEHLATFLSLAGIAIGLAGWSTQMLYATARQILI
jgi:hypothetical protein